MPRFWKRAVCHHETIDSGVHRFIRAYPVSSQWYILLGSRSIVTTSCGMRGAHLGDNRISTDSSLLAASTSFGRRAYSETGKHEQPCDFNRLAGCRLVGGLALTDTS